MTIEEMRKQRATSGVHGDISTLLDALDAAESESERRRALLEEGAALVAEGLQIHESLRAKISRLEASLKAKQVAK